MIEHNKNSSTLCCLGWFVDVNVDTSFFAGAFKEAGDKIVKELGRGENCEHPDKFFMPIAYLYRHSLELKLKKIIELGIEYNLIEKCEPVIKPKDLHNLYKLWNKVKSIFKKHWSNCSYLNEDLRMVEQIVQVFHNIDKSGQVLRYPKNISGEMTLNKLPKAIDLTNFQNDFDKIFNILDGGETGLYEELQLRSEMMSNYL